MLKHVRAASGSDTPPPLRSREPRKARQSSETPYVSLIGLVVIAVVLIGGLIGIVNLSVWSISRVVAQGAGVASSGVLRRQLQQKRLERYRVPVDSTITPLEAGKILHAISRAGHDDELLPWEQPVEPKQAGAKCCTQFSRAASQMFDPKANWSIAAFTVARRGFTAEQRKFLAGIAQSPPLAQFRRVARARAADLGGGLWEVPADSLISWTDLPEMRSLLTDVASSNVAGAALDFEAGRVAAAEQRLREVISVGYLIQYGARTINEEHGGAVLVHYGRTSLEAFFNAVGRKDEATFVSAKSDPAIPRGPGNSPRVRVDELYPTLRRRILDTTESTGARWQLLLGPFAYLPCTSVRQVIFGPDARHRAMLKEFHDSLVEYPSDERRFTMVVRGFSQLIDPGSRYRSSTGSPPWAGFANSVTRNRQLERCASLFRR